MRSYTPLRCYVSAWIIGWAVGVFAPSAIIAYVSPTSASVPSWSGLGRFLSTVWDIADEVGPLAKIVFGLMFVALCLGAASFKLQGALQNLVLYCLSGVAAMVAALLIVPETYSRGFGIGLTGLRFDPTVLPFYIVGGAAAGVAFYLVLRSCLAKSVNGLRSAA